jgi:hypothetical protein
MSRSVVRSLADPSLYNDFNRRSWTGPFIRGTRLWPRRAALPRSQITRAGGRVRVRPVPRGGLIEAARGCGIQCRDGRLIHEVHHQGVVGAVVTICGRLTMARPGGPVEEDLRAVRVSIEARTSSAELQRRKFLKGAREGVGESPDADPACSAASPHPEDFALPCFLTPVPRSPHTTSAPPFPTTRDQPSMAPQLLPLYPLIPLQIQRHACYQSR